MTCRLKCLLAWTLLNRYHHLSRKLGMRPPNHQIGLSIRAPPYGGSECPANHQGIRMQTKICTMQCQESQPLLNSSAAGVIEDNVTRMSTWQGGLFCMTGAMTSREGDPLVFRHMSACDCVGVQRTSDCNACIIFSYRIEIRKTVNHDIFSTFRPSSTLVDPRNVRLIAPPKRPR